MVHEIDHAELKDMIDSDERFILLDVRDKPEYKKDHLPGALHLLISDMDEKAKQMLDMNLTIVTYSEDYDCPASTIAAEKLEQMGFTTMDYKGSYQDWVDHKYSVET
jgi:rhodanese-related sulfurtransferase